LRIITVTNDVLAKLSNVGKDLAQFSLETVKMFRDTPSKPASSSSYGSTSSRKMPPLNDEPQHCTVVM